MEKKKTIDQNEKILDEPSRELAREVTRKVSWEQRIEGTTFHPGPGDEVRYLYRLEEVYNLLNVMPSFSLNFGNLKRWIGETLKDEELAREIGVMLAENPEDLRNRVVSLLGIRLNQCKAVLEDKEDPNN